MRHRNIFEFQSVIAKVRLPNVFLLFFFSNNNNSTFLINRKLQMEVNQHGSCTETTSGMLITRLNPKF